MADAASPDLLEEQRRLLFEALQKAGGFYGSDPNAQNLMGQFMGMTQPGGANGPFTPNVVNAQLATNSDSNAAAFGAQRKLVQRAMANAGLTGSGLEASAIMSAQRQSQAATRTGRQAITSRADLENYQARERAQGMAMNFLQQQAQLQSNALGQEAGYRAQMHETGDATNISSNAGAASGQPPSAAPAPAPARPTQYGTSNTTPIYNMQQQFGPQYGAPGAFGPLQQQTPNMGLYNQQLQQQQRDRQQLLMNQQDWDRRYGGMGGV